ncbi:pantoate--beta-alanine ligase [Arthrobacter sp. B2I5]|uniref:pantoate--beta-alanine ligase n=1 Tax=Arthrobacter sp. B2I5 TaxID=3042266 RepID=UPI00278A60B7|nr:pantoate--beta-alanine ligase [Arthrobacter sp. B2I5]MDQ0826152.1 pantoate--beta-alanine ligase [Arthrobacter sp. B2I5]
MQQHALSKEGQIIVHEDSSSLAAAVARLRAAGRSVALVTTMGALHSGHQELIRQASRDGRTSVVVSIFVNPLQFGPHEDFARYPRDLEADVDVSCEAGADLVFAPSVDEMYPSGDADVVTIVPGPLGDQLEGRTRPGHFAGVLTVVAKFLNIVRPDRIYFGEKDYQQLVLVRSMSSDLNMGVEVVGVPTRRDADGLALSSRNRYLTTEQRTAALTLSQALTAAAAAAGNGPRAALKAAQETLAAQPQVVPDYVELRTAHLAPFSGGTDARLLIAARVGTTRLIDNAHLSFPETT